MLPAMISFDDRELAAVLAAAEPLPPELRGAFLSAVAAALTSTATCDPAALIARVQQTFMALAGRGCTG
jgi:hypothetical protein